MNVNDPAAIRKQVRLYVGVFVALLVATLITVGVSYIHFGREDSHAGNIAVAMVVAVFKAILVAGFFMHLLFEKPSIYTVLAFTLVNFLGLLVLTPLAFLDPPTLTTRSAFNVPPPSAVHAAPAHHVP